MIMIIIIIINTISLVARKVLQNSLLGLFEQQQASVAAALSEPAIKALQPKT